MARVLVHAGFHKTGTTTIQDALRQNRGLLRPHAKLVFRPAITAVCEAARGYSVSGSALDLGLFQYELALFCEQLADQPQPLIVFSAEDLCGHMPGRKGVTDYGAAPALMKALVEVLDQTLAPQEITFYLSTRAPEAWLGSTWAQNLRTTRLTLDRDAYASKFARAANLNGIVARITADVAPHSVHHARLEQHAERPEAPLLDLMGLPPRIVAQIAPVTRANPAPTDQVLNRLLALNRSDLDNADLKAAKRAVIG